MTYQVAFAVTAINQIPGIRSAIIRKGVPLPFRLHGLVVAHDEFQFSNVDVLAVDAIARAQDLVYIANEGVKTIQ